MSLSKFFRWRSALTRSASSASSSFDTAKNKGVNSAVESEGMDCTYRKTQEFTEYQL